MHAIQIEEFGGPDVLNWTEVSSPGCAPDQVIVANQVAGLNYIDTYHRSGLYPLSLPLVPGQEGSGEIIEIGSEVTDLAVGDLVAWTGVSGSYAELVAVPALQAVPVPETLDAETACAVLLQGLTASYLALDTFPLSPGDRCLIHAGAGGVGLLLTQLARWIGAEVFTTVSTEAKAELSREAGADWVVNYSDGSFAKQIEDIAGERPFDVVYDGVGKATFDESLTLIRPRGTMVSFGNASGPVDPVSPLTLASSGSLFLTRPTLIHHVASRPELLERSADLYARVGAGDLKVRIGERVPLSDASYAHRLIEGRSTTGKLVLTV